MFNWLSFMKMIHLLNVGLHFVNGLQLLKYFIECLVIDAAVQKCWWYSPVFELLLSLYVSFQLFLIIIMLIG